MYSLVLYSDISSSLAFQLRISVNKVGGIIQQPNMQHLFTLCTEFCNKRTTFDKVILEILKNKNTHGPKFAEPSMAAVSPYFKSSMHHAVVRRRRKLQFYDKRLPISDELKFQFCPKISTKLGFCPNFAFFNNNFQTTSKFSDNFPTAIAPCSPDRLYSP